MDTPERHFRKLLKGFRTAMLTTRNAEGSLHARPMMVAQIEDDGTLWFVLHGSSRGAQEIDLDAHVNVSMQGRSRFLSLSGDAQVIHDHAKLQDLWRDSWKAWFPEGKEDRDIALVRVEPMGAEYWDNGGVQRLKLLAQTARARVTGTTPHLDHEEHEEHERVDLH